MEEAMAFVNVALERDKVPLKALCQKVFLIYFLKLKGKLF